MTVGVIVFDELSRLLCYDRVLGLVISRPDQARVDSGVLGGLSAYQTGPVTSPWTDLR